MTLHPLMLLLRFSLRKRCFEIALRHCCSVREVAWTGKKDYNESFA